VGVSQETVASVDELRNRALQFVLDEYALLAGMHVLTTSITDDTLPLEVFVTDYEDGEEVARRSSSAYSRRSILSSLIRPFLSGRRLRRSLWTSSALLGTLSIFPMTAR